MRLVETVAEFASYGIQNHVDADLDGYANKPEVANSEPLRCRFISEEHGYEIEKGRTCEELLQVFETACRGDDPRWKLVHIYISDEYKVIFKFADIEAVGTKRSEHGQYIVLSKLNDLAISVDVKRPGHDIPDHYSIETEESYCAKFDKDGERILMHILEKRDGEYYAHGVIFQRKNGKYYFMQQQYD